VQSLAPAPRLLEVAWEILSSVVILIKLAVISDSTIEALEINLGSSRSIPQCGVDLLTRAEGWTYRGQSSAAKSLVGEIARGGRSL